MKRMLAALAMTTAAPVASAWPACDGPELTSPVAVRHEPPEIPEAARALAIEGFVEVALTVLRDGRVGWARVVRADPPGYFEQAALAGVRRWSFEPARLDGKPVECRLHTRVRFTLLDEGQSDTGAG